MKQKDLFSRFKYICLEVTLSAVDNQNNQNNHNLIKIENLIKKYGFNLVASRHNSEETINNLCESNVSHTDLLYKRIFNTLKIVNKS